MSQLGHPKNRDAITVAFISGYSHVMIRERKWASLAFFYLGFIGASLVWRRRH